MNKIFKTKWNTATQAYTVCSELTKRAGKTVGSAAVLLAISVGVMAAEISPNGNGRYIATTSGEITGTTTNTIENNVISVRNGAAVTINGDMTITSHLSVVDGSNIVTVEGGNASLTAGKFTINGTTAVAGQRLHPYAFLVRNNASANIDDLTVNLKVPHEFTNGDSVGRNVDGGVGVAVGTEHYNSGTSKATVKNATINVSNTENSKLGGYYQSIPFLGSIKLLHKGGQITGLYVGTSTDAETTYTSTGLTKILAQDISTNKTAGDYIMGVYVFGPQSKVILNDSDIKVASKGENSFTLKIGNIENNGTSYKGEIVSNGKMKLDSTEAPNSPTILLVSSNSKLDASVATASADIKSANSAVVFGVTDLVYKNAFGGLGGDLSRNKSAENQSVKLNNAVISTTSENASLIKAASALDVDSMANSQAGFTWSNGDFTTKGEFILSGEKSLATAAKKGWLFEAENGSTLNATVDKKAKVEGLVSKNTSGTLNIELDDATWMLAKKGLNENSSTANSIKLKNNAVLDASKASTLSQAELDAEVNKYQTAFDTAEAALTAAQAELATAQAMPAGIARTRAIRNANNKITQATRDKAAAEPALTAAKTAQAAGAQNIALYNVKLTSNGTDNDGTLVNDNSVINLANDSYKDVLTIEGNYEGNNGVIKLNTEWNSPGDDVEGNDSQSDLVEIKGNASGNTIIKAVKIDGTENVINGSIGSIAADLNKNSVPLICVHGTDNGNDIADTAEGGYKYRSTFSGEAKTTGAGVLKLASRKNGAITEYFWTLTSVNPTTVNLDPVVSGYVLAGKTGLEVGYTTLATLHERRGENQTLAWDECGSCGEKAQGQTWGRLFGKQLNLEGQTRLNTKQSILGFQFGHDFAVNRTAEGGHRLTGVFAGYASSNNTFSDRFLTDATGNLAENNQTGKGKQQGWHLGLSHTRYAPNGAYVDLVGQIGLLQTKFNSKDNVEAKQKGTAFALSAEVGRPYALGEHKANEGAWLLEPQAQLSYQGLKLSAFDDGTKQISASTHHGLRGRVGVRLAYNTQAEAKSRTNSFYVIANILQDFSKGKGVQIGQDTINETFAKTSAELGLGGQLPVSQASYIYTDARYERNLRGAKRDGYRGNIGFKYTWQ